MVNPIFEIHIYIFYFKEVRKERDRTTSLAVDVASYFKVEMDD